MPFPKSPPATVTVPETFTGDVKFASGHPWIDVTSSLYGAKGDGVTDDAPAIQAALDAAGGAVVFFPPGTYIIGATLKLNSQQTLLGLSGGPPSGNLNTTILKYTGADATNCIERKAAGQSRLRIKGLRIEDGRVGATAGTGIYFDTVKNLIILHELNVFGWPTDGIYIGSPTPGQTSDCISIRECWVAGARYGINLERLDNQIVIQHVSIELVGGVTQGGIRLAGTGTNAAAVIQGIKMEPTANTQHLLIHDGGPITFAAGLMMRGPGPGGDIVRILNSEGIYVFLADIGGVTQTNLVNNVQRGYTITGSRLAYWVGGGEGYTMNQAILRGLNSGEGAATDAFLDGKMFLGSAPPYTAQGTLSLKSRAIGDVTLLLQQLAGQTAALMRAVNSAGSSVFLINNDGSLNVPTGFVSDIWLTAVGKGLRVKEGTNAKQGTAVLVGGTVVVNNTAVTATSRIMLTIQTPGGTPGAVYVSARTAGTSFTITSTSVVDTSTVAYEIFEPG